jgi:hypothetical protein
MTNTDLSKIDFSKCKLPSIDAYGVMCNVEVCPIRGSVTIKTIETSERDYDILAILVNRGWDITAITASENLIAIVAMCKTVDEFIEQQKLPKWEVKAPGGHYVAKQTKTLYADNGFDADDVTRLQFKLACAILKRDGSSCVTEDGFMFIPAYNARCQLVKH